MIRIIAGKNKGKKLLLPDEKITRPTSDRARESLFNILAHHANFDLSGARVLDAFAGSGALGLEALSRGANHVTFVESHPKILPVLRQNVASIAIKQQVQILSHPIESIGKISQSVDLVFLDPPYKQELEIATIQLLHRQGWINNSTLICLEMHLHDPLDEQPFFQVLDQRAYGQTKIILGKIP